MITANTKVTALEVLQECGVENAQDVFGKMRVRIGGITGINNPNRIINIQPEVTNLEVIVGGDVFDLELSKGNKSDNAEVFTISDAAKEQIEAEGAQDSEKAEHLTKVKNLARRLVDTQGDYEPTKEEAKYMDEAQAKVEDMQNTNPDMNDENLDRRPKHVRSK